MTRSPHFLDRRALLKWMMMGGAWMLSGPLKRSWAMGGRPPAQGIQKMEGTVEINGRPARIGQVIRPGDVITTGPRSQVVFVADTDVFLLRDGSRFVVPAGEEAATETSLDLLKMANGKMLSVFGRGRKRIETGTAVIGVRGTGIYVEADAARTYVCTCYGVVEMAAMAEPENPLRISAQHHEQPRFIYSGGSRRLITPAPMMNHTDAELIFLESLAGRKPPFVGSTVKKYKGRGNGGSY